jgi:hypothetical protein
MGASTFLNIAKGKTAQEAFTTAREQALYDYGHSGYSGTIAEKSSFVVVPFKGNSELRTDNIKEARRFADGLIDAGDPRIDDKWGPAGCIDLGEGEFLFFGWASE